MYNNNENGDKSSLASADFKKIIPTIGSICPDWLKYFLRKNGFVELGDGLKLVSVADDDHILRVIYPNGNYRNVVKNHSVGPKCNWKYITEQVRHIVCGHYNVPDPKNFPTFNDWAEDLYEYGFCNSEKRWEKFQKEFGVASMADYEAETAKFNA